MHLYFSLYFTFQPFYTFNLSTAFIDFFAWIGWATDLKTVPQEMIEARKARTGDKAHLHPHNHHHHEEETTNIKKIKNKLEENALTDSEDGSEDSGNVDDAGSDIIKAATAEEKVKAWRNYGDLKLLKGWNG